jgi:hypothetical protein
VQYVNIPVCYSRYFALLFFNAALSRVFSFFKVKTYQFKRNVKGDQIICQKLQISNPLILEIVLHVTRNSAFIDAELRFVIISVSSIDFSEHSLSSKL